MTTADPPTVLTERDGPVLVVRLHNPPHNFMTAGVVAELDALTRSLRRDRSVRAVVVASAVRGRFMAHVDVAEILAEAERIGLPVGPRTAAATMRAAGLAARVPGLRAALRRTPARGLLEVQRVHAVLLRMNRMDRPFVAAIGGPALGGGCDLALACDIRYMAEGCGGIGFPETTLGLIPGAGGSQRLTRALGPARAIEHLLEGRPLTPAEALDAGLVHRVLDPEALLPAAVETARRLARRSPVAIRAAKRAVYRHGSRSLEAGLAGERALALVVASSRPARAAMRAYLDELASHGTPAWVDDDAIAPWLEGGPAGDGRRAGTHA